jgi:hypothetical protein
MIAIRKARNDLRRIPAGRRKLNSSKHCTSSVSLPWPNGGKKHRPLDRNWPHDLSSRCTHGCSCATQQKIEIAAEACSNLVKRFVRHIQVPQLPESPECRGGIAGTTGQSGFWRDLLVKNQIGPEFDPGTTTQCLGCAKDQVAIVERHTMSQMLRCCLGEPKTQLTVRAILHGQHVTKLRSQHHGVEFMIPVAPAAQDFKKHIELGWTRQCQRATL